LGDLIGTKRVLLSGQDVNATAFANEWCSHKGAKRRNKTGIDKQNRREYVWPYFNYWTIPKIKRTLRWNSSQ